MMMVYMYPMSSVEGYLFGIGDDSGVDGSEVGTPSSLFGHQLAKRRREQPQDVPRHEDDREPQDARIRGLFPSFFRQTSKSCRHQHNVEKRFTHMWVNMSHCRRELLYVLSERVVRIGQPTIKVAYPIVCLISEVKRVGIVDQSGSDGKSKLTLEKSDQTVHKGSRDCNKQPVDTVLEKESRILLNDGLDYSSVELSHIDGEKRSWHERSCVEHKKKELFTQGTWNWNPQKLEDLTDKFSVDSWTPLPLLWPLLQTTCFIRRCGLRISLCRLFRDGETSWAGTSEKITFASMVEHHTRCTGYHHNTGSTSSHMCMYHSQWSDDVSDEAV